MKLQLDLPKDRWDFIKNKLEPFTNDSETITLFLNAIESLSFEESWSQKIFQCLTSNGKNPFKFPTTTELEDCTYGSAIVKQCELSGTKWRTLEVQYYQFLLDHYSMQKK
jgi:hypothetical protein